MYYPVSKALGWVADPADLSLLLLVGAVAVRRRAGTSAALAVAAALVAGAFSSPAVVDVLQGWLESAAPNTYRPDVHYDAAIVFSGSDRRVDGAAGVVTSGGGRHLLYTGRISRRGAEQLRRHLVAAGIPAEAIVIADGARNTRENALESSEVVAERGWSKLLLVTSAAHVPRALASCHALGLEPDVLPVDYTARAGPASPELRRWLPSRSALAQSRDILHELIGLVAYRALGYAT